MAGLESYIAFTTHSLTHIFDFRELNGALDWLQF